MRPSERWQEIKEILYPALQMEADTRASYLAERCGNDRELRREVESLIAAHGAAERLESPALEVIAAGLPREAGDGLAGKMLGHYNVIEKLGAGGMGEVFLAEDTSLGRKVALKLLPPYFTREAERVRRFQQEARAASALNHPNILTIYEIRQVDSTHYIATEFIEGETLRERMGRGGVKINEALDLAIQVAGALAAAHDAGIVHRDVKPENIMLRRDGIVKVLDFGLAKLTEKPTRDAEASTMVHTDEGIVMGTVQYMSPEQARGIRVDGRTDIWSLGCVIYEMLAGRAPFTGPTPSDVIVSVLERQPPPLVRYCPELPPELDWLVQKALRKDAAERYQTSRELLSDLRDLKHRFEFEAALERSGSPDNETGVIARPSGEQPPVETFPQPAAHLTSTAEYIVTGIKRHKFVSVLVAGVLAMAAAAGIYFYSNRTQPLTEKDTILIAEFVNTTGDPVFDGTLKQALAVQLGQSPFINIFPDQRVREALRFMERPSDERVTREIGREICQREAIKALLTGSIANLGSNYVIALEALNGQTGETLVLEQVEAASKEQVISKLGEAATRLRAKLGESLSSIRKFDAPIQQATTSSLDAFKAYVLGQEVGRKGDIEAAIVHFKRAVELDPNFAMAHVALGVAYTNVPDPANLSAQYVTKGFELRDRVTEFEKLRISELYHAFATGDLDQHLEILEMSHRTYPGRTGIMNNLAFGYLNSGQYEKAVEIAGEGLRTGPNNAPLYVNLGYGYMALGRYDEAKAIFDQALGRDLNFHLIHSNAYLLAVARGDRAEMQRRLDWAKGKPMEYSFVNFQSWVEMKEGRAGQARATALRAAETARNRGANSDAVDIIHNSAAWNALVGDCGQASAQAKAFTASGEGRVPQFAALWRAICGDAARAQPILDDLARRRPNSTEVNLIWGPVSRAAIEIKKGDPSEAVRILQKSSRYEMGVLAGYWPVYIRGLAYLKKGAATEAMAEFQKIIDRPGVWPASVHLPLAHLGLARSTALAGDNAKSRKAYQDFFALWKDADPDIPILLEARKEYEKLAP